jgi:hypothetical protein
MKEDENKLEISFINISSWVVKNPSSGHLFSLHSELIANSLDMFHSSYTWGPLQESSALISPVFRWGHYQRGWGTLLQGRHLQDDLRRAEELLDSIPGAKCLHFYEGGFRELTFLSRLIKNRTDCVAIFNFFSPEPWLALIRKRSLTSFWAKKILSRELHDLKDSTAFMADTESAGKKLSEALNLEGISVYPLFTSVKPRNSGNSPWESRPNDLLFATRTKAEKGLVKRTLRFLAHQTSSRLNAVIVSRWNSRWTKRDLAGLSSANIAVQVPQGPVDDRGYSEMFFNTKVVVLPYLDPHYIDGSSGKILDAVAGGCIAVAPRFTAAGRLIEQQGWGTTFDGPAENLALVLGSINLFTEPNQTPKPNSIETSIKILAESARHLQAYSGPKKHSRLLQALPFLVGVDGMPWVFLHIVLAPGKRLVARIDAFLRAQKSRLNV